MKFTKEQIKNYIKSMQLRVNGFDIEREKEYENQRFEK